MMRKNDEGRAGFAGLTTCGSVWACPCCSSKIISRRQEDLAAAVSRWTASGGRVVMLTLTMRHKRQDRLDPLWAALGSAWRSVTSGAVWQAEKAAHGVAGWLRVVETTEGANGWHVHVHALLFVRDEVSDSAVAAWKKSVFGRWSRALGRAGLRPASLAAQDMHLVVDADAAVGEYLAKGLDFGNVVAMEFTQSAGKKSRAAAGGRTPWDILDSVIATGDADDLDRWLEWEATSKGKRQLTWSQGLRELIGLGVEESDDELAAEELGSKDDNVILIPLDQWKATWKNPVIAAIALGLLETSGVDATIAFLRSCGVSAQRVNDS